MLEFGEIDLELFGDIGLELFGDTVLEFMEFSSEIVLELLGDIGLELFGDIVLGDKVFGDIGRELLVGRISPESSVPLILVDMRFDRKKLELASSRMAWVFGRISLESNELEMSFSAASVFGRISLPSSASSSGEPTPLDHINHELLILALSSSNSHDGSCSFCSARSFSSWNSR